MKGVKEFKKGQDVKLTKNFSSSEFDCNCSYESCKSTLIDLDHVEKLQYMRDKWKKPVKINSAYK